MNIISSDGFGGAKYKGVDMPTLHGHVKMKIWNPKTHKTDFEFEGSNIVTNAIPDILSRNLLGSVNYGSMLPLCEKFFGGVLAFRNAFSTVTIDGNVVPDPSKYYPEGDDVNPCIAHAGDTAPASATIVAQDYKRGSPTGVVKTGNSIKFNWQWLPSQGNGIINSVGLTHVDTGNAGLGSTADAFKNFYPFANLTSSDLTALTESFDGIQSLFAQYDDNHGLYFHIGEDSDWYSGHSSFSTTKLTVKIRRLPFFKTGLHELLSVVSLGERSFEITTGYTMYVQPAYYFDYTNKYLWIFSNATKVAPSSADASFTWNQTTVNYTIIDCVNESIVSEGTIVSNASDLAPVTLQTWQNTSYPDTISKWITANIIIDGDYAYLPMSNGISVGDRSNLCTMNIRGFKRINMTDSSDQTELTFNDVQTQFLPSMKFGGLIVNGGRVINNGVGYTCKSQLPFGGMGNRAYTNYALTSPDGVSTYANAIGTGNGTTGSANRYLLASKLILSTKYNLPSQVEKTGVQAMTIEYTLTES